MRSELKNAIKGSFTITPNELINDFTISLQAKSLFTLLASKPDNWKFYNQALIKEMSCSADSLRKYIKELQSNGWLENQGQANEKGKFGGNIYKLNVTKFSDTVKNRNGRKPTPKNPDTYKQGIKIKGKKKKEVSTIASKKIKKSQFNTFWKLYPKKSDKGKAKTKWDTLCGKPNKDKPDWREIKLAIINQKKTERWQNPKFIPNPATWLNQSRWLDDPKEMVNYDWEDKENEFVSTTDFGEPDSIE